MSAAENVESLEKELAMANKKLKRAKKDAAEAKDLRKQLAAIREELEESEEVGVVRASVSMWSRTAVFCVYPHFVGKYAEAMQYFPNSSAISRSTVIGGV